MKSAWADEWVEASGAVDAFDCAGAETLGRLATASTGRIGHERGDRRAGSRDERAEVADDGTACHVAGAARRISALGPLAHIAQTDVSIFQILPRPTLVDALHEFGDGEEAEGERLDLDSIAQFDDAEM